MNAGKGEEENRIRTVTLSMESEIPTAAISEPLTVHACDYLFVIWNPANACRCNH